MPADPKTPAAGGNLSPAAPGLTQAAAGGNLGPATPVLLQAAAGGNLGPATPALLQAAAAGNLSPTAPAAVVAAGGLSGSPNYLETNLAGANNDVRFVQVSAGTAPTVRYIQGSSFQAKAEVSVIGEAITVTLIQNFGSSSTTANEVIAAVNAHPQASLLVLASLKTGDSGAGTMGTAVFAATALAGGTMSAAGAIAAGSGGNLSPSLPWLTRAAAAGNLSPAAPAPIAAASGNLSPTAPGGIY